MLTKEDKFQKILNLYTKVVDAGLTWGISSDEELIQNQRMVSLTDNKNTGPNVKYILRQNVSTSNQSNDNRFAKNYLQVGQNNLNHMGLNNDYQHVKNGSRPKNDIELKLKKFVE